MISQDNYDESVQKWSTIVKILQNSTNRIRYKGGYLQLLSESEESVEDEIVVIESCGFCKEFHSENPREGEDECEECPLYQEEMCHTSGFYRQKVFWHFVDLLDGEIEEALPFAQEILERVKKEPITPIV